MNSKDLLEDVFNVKNGSLILLRIMAAIGITILGKNIFSDESSLFNWIISLFLLGIPIGYYLILRRKELRYSQVVATQKNILIMVFPSNLSLLKKVLNISNNKSLDKNKFGVQKIYFLRTKNMPLTQENKDMMLGFLKAYSIEIEIRQVDALENPLRLQDEVEDILGKIQNKNNCAINVQTGTKASSIFLYELALKNEIEVHYLSSLYDKDNNPIDKSENLYTLKSEYLDKDS